MQVKSEIIDKLDFIFMTGGEGDDLARVYFVTSLRGMFDEPSIDPRLRQAVDDFLDSVDRFLDLLLNLRDLPTGDEYQDDRTVCTLRLLNFIRRIGGRDAMCESPSPRRRPSYLLPLLTLSSPLPQTSNTSTSSSTRTSVPATTPRPASRSRCTPRYTTGRAAPSSSRSRTATSPCRASHSSPARRLCCCRRSTTSVSLPAHEHPFPCGSR